MTEESLASFLNRALAITSAWEKVNGRWSLNDQIAHTHSEVSEVFQAVKHLEGDERELEEISDAVLSCLTLFHVRHFANSEIIRALEKTLSKVEQRVSKATQSKAENQP